MNNKLQALKAEKTRVTRRYRSMLRHFIFSILFSALGIILILCAFITDQVTSAQSERMLITGFILIVLSDLEDIKFWIER
jgi:hypothetical protein